METLDKCFENVCELDLIFHMDKVCSILKKMEFKFLSKAMLVKAIHKLEIW